MTELDCRGLSCPEPVLKTRLLLERLQTGEVQVMVSTDVARDNIQRLASRLGWSAESIERDGELHIVLRR